MSVRRKVFEWFPHSSYLLVLLCVFCCLFICVDSLQNQQRFNVISGKQSVVDNLAHHSSWFPNTPTRTSVTGDLAEETTKGISKLFPFLERMDRRAFLPSFIQSLFMILVTELGDKTFFIAAIMAMKNSRILVFQGALCALLCMTLLSVALGKTFPLLFSKKYTSLAAGVLFAYFGIQLLRDWWISRSNNTSNVDDELNELEEQITTGSYHSESSESRLHMSLSSDSIGSRNKYARSNSSSASNGQLHHNTTAPTFYPFVSHVALQLFSPVFVRSFSLTFLAEWGDRSQVATVALSASKDMYGVCIGAIAGHFVCTGLAVLGGRLLASRISERTVGFIGGILFLVFSVLSFSGQLE
ncbi:uncharacterized protein Gasu_01380 [Galdieria sulphuraria]|uniref:GDT1 family protein n=1 Tax=Galdieria sulphuraria TaxID=130081 RepID=M2WA50_GALSU|nr:uncharacterized protein Gasu_01380 [Galdieria sulphuraria]EME32776.1 hypothetical protein Gasu_01380 [Galdieria sulphuraria]|eukprot:XP_005709296.1 hypothetical protein Gasu_01380 [Galdieria sulphuraria]